MCLVAAVGQGAPNRLEDVRAVQVLLNLNRTRTGGAGELAMDGQFGRNTRDAIVAFQTTVQHLQPGDGMVEPGGATLDELARGIGPGLNREKLAGIYAHAQGARIDLFLPHLAAAMAKYDIGSPRRQAHFLAQVGHECGELLYMEELASGDAYEGRADLGNTEPGDGRRFKGRGLIQLTGRANYKAYGEAIGVDLTHEGNWNSVAADPARCVDVAGWFWRRKGLNALADADDVREITRRINGGFNGLEDRQAKLARATFFLPVA